MKMSSRGEAEIMVRGRVNRPDLVLSNGAIVEFKAGKDANGLPVLSSIEIYFVDNKGDRSRDNLPEGGISQKLLREIDISQAISSYFRQLESNKSSNKDLNALLRKQIVNGFERSGRKPAPIEAYASLAFLYIEACKFQPRNPTRFLANQFGVEHRTMVGRLAKAKKLGLLSTQDSGSPSGRAGAEMSDHCEKIIKELINKE